jgi:hypothetical protein
VRGARNVRRDPGSKGRGQPPSDTPTKWNGIIIRLRGDGESGMFPTLVQEALAKIESKAVGKSL